MSFQQNFSETIAKDVVSVSMDEEMSESFLAYSMSVITARALPDVRDGLKPVQRRILYSMLKMGLRPDSPHRKSARVVGETMGKYHPHGDASIYESLVKLGQPFSRNVPLVHPQGNFGSLDDPPAASRYTECRLSDAAFFALQGVDEGTVDFTGTYDGETLEPTCLPAGLPVLLCNGASGIAVGMSTSMLPYNLGEVTKLLVAVLNKVFSADKPKTKTFVKQTFGISAAALLKLSPEELLDVEVSELQVPEKLEGVRGMKGSKIVEMVPAPDFPSGGVISESNMEEIYDTGNGSVTVDAKIEVEKKGSRTALIVTELPWQVGPEKVIEKIREKKEAGTLDFVRSVANLSDRKTGLRIRVDIKSKVSAEVAIQKLLRSTPLRTSFRVNNVVLANGTPVTLGMFDLCRHYLYHRVNTSLRLVHTRRTKAMLRKEILEGYLSALAEIDEVVKIIKESESTDEAKESLKSLLDVNDRQAVAVLDLRLKRLTDLEVNKIDSERCQLAGEIKEYDIIFGDEAQLKKVVRKSLQESAKQFGTPRKTGLPVN